MPLSIGCARKGICPFENPFARASCNSESCVLTVGFLVRWKMHHMYTKPKGGDALCPLGFHPQVRWPTRCKRCFRWAFALVSHAERISLIAIWMLQQRLQGARRQQEGRLFQFVAPRCCHGLHSSLVLLVLAALRTVSHDILIIPQPLKYRVALFPIFVLQKMQPQKQSRARHLQTNAP